jgi:hypothetical protein
MTGGASHSGVRRPKSAKARSRGKFGASCAGERYGDLIFVSAVIAEDVRDLQSWSNHDRRRYGAGGFSVSRFVRLRRGVFSPASGLSTLEIIPVATRV